MELIQTLIEWMARGVEAVAAVIIMVAAARAAWRAGAQLRGHTGDGEATVEIRLALGRSLGLALEFALAADILSTAMTPTWDDIGKLAAIAAIRTALNYFLALEIARESLPTIASPRGPS